MAGKGHNISTPGGFMAARQAGIDKYGASSPPGGMAPLSGDRAKEFQTDVKGVLDESRAMNSGLGSSSGDRITNTGPEQKKLGTTLGS